MPLTACGAGSTLLRRGARGSSATCGGGVELKGPEPPKVSLSPPRVWRSSPVSDEPRQLGPVVSHPKHFLFMSTSQLWAVLPGRLSPAPLMAHLDPDAATCTRPWTAAIWAERLFSLRQQFCWVKPAKTRRQKAIIGPTSCGLPGRVLQHKSGS